MKSHSVKVRVVMAFHLQKLKFHYMFVYFNPLLLFESRMELAWHSGNGLPRDGPGFDSQWELCENRASCPSQGTVNGVLSLNDLAVDGTLNTTNHEKPWR